MDVSTRPSQRRRQWLRSKDLLLAAFLLVSANPVWALPQDLSDETPETTGSIAQDTTHEVAIQVVEPGAESITLHARLTAQSTTLAESMAWQVRNSMGEMVFSSEATEASIPLPPGDYIVEAQYGAVSLRESINLPEGHSLRVGFILNAGALRVLPGLKGITDVTLNSKTLIYALSGPSKGKLIAHASIPGEVIKLGAGQYRVESRFAAGNAVVVTDVRVRPGRMSALEVNHAAGLARLSFVGAPTASVSWDLRTETGEMLSKLDGLAQNVPLKPGTYIAEAHVNGETLSAKFHIRAGETRDIMLGN